MLHNTCDKIKTKCIEKRCLCNRKLHEKAFLKYMIYNKNVNLNNYNDDYDKIGRLRY
mgnify:CR=1 FL=1